MRIEKKEKRRIKEKGFTLIELMVASTIFIIVMVVSIGAVLSIVDANRKAQSLNSVITNLNFAVESMTRDLREGIYYCNSDITGFKCSTDRISFINSHGDASYYEFVPPSGSNGGSICKYSNGTCSNITAPEVNIQSVTFDHAGDSPDPDHLQPTILLNIRGVAGVNFKTQSTFNIQTFITQRLLDS